METATKTQVLSTFAKMASELSTKQLREYIVDLSDLVEDTSSSDAPWQLAKNYSTAWMCFNSELKKRLVNNG